MVLACQQLLTPGTTGAVLIQKNYVAWWMQWSGMGGDVALDVAELKGSSLSGLWQLMAAIEAIASFSKNWPIGKSLLAVHEYQLYTSTHAHLDCCTPYSLIMSM